MTSWESRYSSYAARERRMPSRSVLGIRRFLTQYCSFNLARLHIILPSWHITLKQRRFDVVPTLCACWVCCNCFFILCTPETHREETYMYLLTCAPSEDSDPCSLIRVFVFHIKKHCIIGYLKMCPVEILIRLLVCAAWSESSLGAHVRRYVFWRSGSTNCFTCKHVYTSWRREMYLKKSWESEVPEQSAS